MCLCQSEMEKGWPGQLCWFMEAVCSLCVAHVSQGGISQVWLAQGPREGGPMGGPAWGEGLSADLALMLDHNPQPCMSL